MEGSSKAPQDIENPCIPLETSKSKALEGLPPLSDLCCIYKVPERLRCANEKAYTPQAVSIGPIHHGKKGLEDMEEHKKRYLRYFLDWTKVTLKDCETKIRGKETDLRSCYAHTIGLHSDEFVRIILVDAAFIIVFLLKYCLIIKPDRNDRIFHKPWLRNSIGPDLLLLENQLPFFILQDLFDAESWKKIAAEAARAGFSSNGNSRSNDTAIAEVPATKLLVFLSYCFLKKERHLYVEENDFRRILSSPSFKVEHFVDFLRTLQLPTEEENRKNRGSVKTVAVPSMTKLHQAGVKFKVRSSKSLFDICFQHGTLEIPKLEIDDYTEQELRNFIAFEQCHFSCNYFSDYISLMDDLVNTPNDVELLHKNGIVEILLGDNNEVSTLINSLGKGVRLNSHEFYYATLSRALNDHNKKLWNKWKAELRQKYFETPWKTISIIAAAFIIILTLLQTVWTIAY